MVATYAGLPIQQKVLCFALQRVTRPGLREHSYQECLYPYHSVVYMIMGVGFQTGSIVNYHSSC